MFCSVLLTIGLDPAYYRVLAPQVRNNQINTIQDFIKAGNTLKQQQQPRIQTQSFEKAQKYYKYNNNFYAKLQHQPNLPKYNAQRQEAELQHNIDKLQGTRNWEKALRNNYFPQQKPTEPQMQPKSILKRPSLPWQDQGTYDKKRLHMGSLRAKTWGIKNTIGSPFIRKGNTTRKAERPITEGSWLEPLVDVNSFLKHQELHGHIEIMNIKYNKLRNGWEISGELFAYTVKETKKVKDIKDGISKQAAKEHLLDNLFIKMYSEFCIDMTKLDNYKPCTIELWNRMVKRIYRTPLESKWEPNYSCILKRKHIRSRLNELMWKTLLPIVAGHESQRNKQTATIKNNITQRLERTKNSEMILFILQKEHLIKKVEKSFEHTEDRKWEWTITVSLYEEPTKRIIRQIRAASSHDIEVIACQRAHDDLISKLKEKTSPLYEYFQPIPLKMLKLACVREENDESTSDSDEVETDLSDDESDISDETDGEDSDFDEDEFSEDSSFEEDSESDYSTDDDGDIDSLPSDTNTKSDESDESESENSPDESSDQGDIPQVYTLKAQTNHPILNVRKLCKIYKSFPVETNGHQLATSLDTVPPRPVLKNLLPKN